MISTWNQRLAEQVERKYENYKPYRLALDAALDNKELVLAGDTFIVIAASSIDALASVRLNSTSNDALELKLGIKIKTVFTHLFFSCTAQTGEWLDYLVGVDFDLDQVDTDYLDYLAEQIAAEQASAGVAQPAIMLTNATPDLDTQAAAHAATGAIIKSLSTNGGLVWVNISAAAVDGSCYELAAGEKIIVPLTNTNQIHALFKTANNKLAVIYKV